MQKISVSLQNKNSNSKFMIEDRRRTVARLLAQSMTETEIAITLDVHVSTICRDIKALKAKSQQFVYDLCVFNAHMCFFVMALYYISHVFPWPCIPSLSRSPLC